MSLVDEILKEAQFLPQIRRFSMNRPQVMIPRMSIGNAKDPYQGLDPWAPFFKAGHEKAETTTTMGTIHLDSNTFVVQLEVSLNYAFPAAGIRNKLVKDLAKGLDTEAVNEALESADSQLRFYDLAPIATAFATTVRALPTKYQSGTRGFNLYVSNDLLHRFESWLGTHMGGLSLATTAHHTYMGIPVLSLSCLPPGTILFTNPDNIVWGLSGQGDRGQALQDVQRDTVRYELRVDVAFAVQNPEAVVVTTLLTPSTLRKRWHRFKLWVAALWGKTRKLFRKRK